MLLQTLINSDIDRVLKRRKTAYSEGRLAGYRAALDLVRNIDVYALSCEYVEGRKVLREALGSVPGTGDYRAGYYKSMRNVYTAMYHITYDPSGVYKPVTEAQFRMIGIVSKQKDKEFYGLTSYEANIFIKENADEH